MRRHGDSRILAGGIGFQGALQIIFRGKRLGESLLAQRVVAQIQCVVRRILRQCVRCRRRFFECGRRGVDVVAAQQRVTQVAIGERQLVAKVIVRRSGLAEGVQNVQPVARQLSRGCDVMIQPRDDTQFPKQTTAISLNLNPCDRVSNARFNGRLRFLVGRARSCSFAL